MQIINRGQTTPAPIYLAARQAGGDLAVFDSPADVIASLAPGYPDEAAKGQVAAYIARHDLARRLVASATDHAWADQPVQAMPDAARYALSARGARAITEVQTWEHKTPLYVVGTFHRPYTDVPLPEGNVIVIDPSTEADLVASIAAGGLIDAVDVAPGSVWQG
ncbi:hypothetical protein GZ998_03480 [Actinomyces sp. 594]|uniref:hypothetical protein n=1 Tax=Actinomyces sp. 594 TaxID=2057793 RepID=UPI001C57318D|nr:hypothetical protein [Actinomyces sp. 594]MBW3068575.1 hypothetical protein [Actinomyces sp. 594]